MFPRARAEDARTPRPRRRSPALLAFRSRMAVWLVAVGAVGGLGAAAFVAALSALEPVLGPEHHEPGVHLLVLVGVGAVVALVTRLLGPPGDVDLLVDNIHVLGGAAEARSLRSLLPVSLLCIAAGGALGPEAPLVQSTGTFGTWVGRRRRMSPRDVRIVTITGMAAGFAVLFAAPLGSAVFALEILHRRGLEYYEALVPSLVGALTGWVVFVAATSLGMEPIWSFPTPAPGDLADLVPAVGLGLVGAAIATAFVHGNRLARRLAARLPTSVRPMAGGLVLGLLALWTPYALTFGELQVESLLDPEVTVGALAVAGVAKLLASTCCLATGWKGGFIIPLFFVGATAGRAAHLAFPDLDLALCLAAAMVATCVGVTNTPLGATLVVAGMAGTALLPMVLVAALVSFFCTRRVNHFDAQRSRPDRDGAAPDRRSDDPGGVPA